MSLKNNTTIPFIGNETALGQQNWTCIFIDSTAERISKLCAYCFILFNSLFGNIFIIIIVYKHRDLRKTVNYFIVNMSVSDLLFSLALLPVEITKLVTDSAHWRMSGISESIFLASQTSVLVSVQSLMWIAIDRFVAVVFPMKTGLISSKVRTIAIVSTWICASLVKLPQLISSQLDVRGNHTVYAETNMESFLSNNNAYGTYLWLQFCLFIIVPLVVITVLYTAIAITLTMRKKALAGLASNAQRHATKKRRQAIKITVAILVLFYLCITPLTLVYFIPNWRPSCPIQRVLYLVTSFSLYLSSTVNPFICLSFVESYRRGLRNILFPCGRKLNGNVTPKCGEINLMKMKSPHDESYRQSCENSKSCNKTFDTVL